MIDQRFDLKNGGVGMKKYKDYLKESWAIRKKILLHKYGAKQAKQ